MQNLLTPTILYITGLTLLAILIVVLWLSVYYYWRAKEIAPYLMRLEDLLKKIAMAQNTLEETKAELRAKTDEIARADKLVADGKAGRTKATAARRDGKCKETPGRIKQPHAASC